MRCFSGSGGRLFLASDALPFSRSLADCGDGWSWRDGDGAWWGDDLSFTVDDQSVAPDALFRLAGRVSFARCLRGRSVVASGTHYPTVCAAAAVSWSLRVLVPLGETSGLADEHATYSEGMGRSAVATLEAATVEPWLRDALVGARVLAQLPYPHSSGLIVGVGVASYGVADTTTVQIAFDEGEVTYVH